MNLIDFDAAFSQALSRWIEDNRGHYKTADALEEAAPEFYTTWLQTPADFLAGETPSGYFARYTVAAELIALMRDYITEGVAVPDPLVQQLLALGDEDALLALLQDKSAPVEAKMLAVDTLRELGSDKPLVDYIRWQVERTEDEDLLDAALESLALMGDKVFGPAKIAFTAADEAGKEALLDILAQPGADESVVTFAIERFQTQQDKRALYAGYLGKLDDERAVAPLLIAADDKAVPYIDYIEIRNAIERLGGEAPYRDFTDDPTYQAVQQLQLR